MPAHPPLERVGPWSFVDGNKPIEAIVSGPLVAHDFPTLLGAAVEGMGLAQVPAPTSASLMRAGKLVPVLEPFAPMEPGVFLYYPDIKCCRNCEPSSIT